MSAKLQGNQSVSIPSDRQQGVTLIELLVTLVILMIALTIVVPGFQGFLRHSQTQAVQDDFLAAVAFARSEAVARGQRMQLCSLNAAQNDCELGAANANHFWTNRGWGVRPVGGNFIRVWDPSVALVVLDRQADTGTSIEFDARGRLTTNPSPEFLLITAGRDIGSRIEFSISGRARFTDEVID